MAVRDAWPGEASDFTPWLSTLENLSLLAKEVGFEIEVIETESGVGPYRADILAQRTNSNEKIVIENQFGKTDHNHLGQLLTYAAGVGTDGAGAKTIIWIAEHFTEPHRAALDWLNKCTEPGIGFFGVQLQLWKIGTSAFAPQFNVISRPNNWQKQLTQESSKLSDTAKLYQSFWTDFIEYCNARSTTLSFPSPWPRHWLPITIGKVGFSVVFTASRQKNRVGCELYLTGSDAKIVFASFLTQRQHIMQQLVSHPEFQELPDKDSSRIVEYKSVELSNKTEWPDFFSWLKERGERYVTVFAPLAKQTTSS